VLINFYAPVQIKSFKAKPTNSVVLIASRNFIGQLMEKERVSNMEEPEEAIMVHIKPIASFDEHYIHLDKVKEIVQEVVFSRAHREDLVEADYVHLAMLRNVIEKSLSCVVGHTESGVPVPCYTDRMEGNKAMLLYLAIQALVPMDMFPKRWGKDLFEESE